MPFLSRPKCSLVASQIGMGLSAIFQPPRRANGKPRLASCRETKLQVYPRPFAFAFDAFRPSHQCVASTSTSWQNCLYNPSNRVQKMQLPTMRAMPRGQVCMTERTVLVHSPRIHENEARMHRQQMVLLHEKAERVWRAGS